jgi:hypothetical protein
MSVSMGFIARLVIGGAVAAVGALMVIRTMGFLEFFGPVAWAEEKLGAGGSALFYKLLGVVIAFLGFAVMTNIWNDILIATLGQLFPQYRK